MIAVLPLAHRPDPADILANWHDGLLELWLAHRDLRLRCAYPALRAVRPGCYRDVFTDAILDCLQARPHLETILPKLPIASLVRQ